MMFIVVYPKKITDNCQIRSNANQNNIQNDRSDQKFTNVTNLVFRLLFFFSNKPHRYLGWKTLEFGSIFVR